MTFYFLKLKASYLPLLMLLLDLILAGQFSMLCSGTGYVAGHMYLFFDTLYPAYFGGGARSKLLSTPRILKLIFPQQTGPNSNVQRTAYGTAFHARDGGDASSSSSAGGGAAAGSTATASGFGRFSFSGSFKGKGRRLGD